MKYFLFFFICIATNCAAHKHDPVTFPKPFEIESIDTFVGSKDQLFVKANEWVVKTFVSAKDVIQMNDKDAGKIIVKGVITSSETGAMYVATNYIKFTMSIDIKDGRCRFKLTDFVYTDKVSGGHTYTSNRSLDDEKNPPYLWPKQWDKVRGDSWQQALSMHENFKKALNSKSDNW